MKDEELDLSKVPQEDQPIVEYFRQECDILCQVEVPPSRSEPK